MFKANEEVIYIGMTTKLYNRLHQHRTKSGFWEEVDTIQIASFESNIDMAVYEIILINNLKPKYNSLKFDGECSFEIPSIRWKEVPKLNPVE